MFWQRCAASLMALAVLGNSSLGEKPKATGKDQITNSIGMKLVLIPSGEFLMGCGESEEKMAAFLEATQGDVYTRQATLQ